MEKTILTSATFWNSRVCNCPRAFPAMLPWASSSLRMAVLGFLVHFAWRESSFRDPARNSKHLLQGILKPSFLSTNLRKHVLSYSRCNAFISSEFKIFVKHMLSISGVDSCKYTSHLFGNLKNKKQMQEP